MWIDCFHHMLEHIEGGETADASAVQGQEIQLPPFQMHRVRILIWNLTARNDIGLASSFDLFICLFYVLMYPVI